MCECVNVVAAKGQLQAPKIWPASTSGLTAERGGATTRELLCNPTFGEMHDVSESELFDFETKTTALPAKRSL